MKYSIFFIIILTIFACTHKNAKKNEGKVIDQISKSISEVKEESDTTIYDYSSKRIIKMNSKDSTEAFENKIYYEKDTNEITVFELTNVKEVESIKQSLAQRITLIYKHNINGYKVRVVSGNNKDNSEKLKSIVEFTNSKGYKKIFLVIDFFDFNLNEIVYNFSKQNKQKDTTIYEDYRQIEKDKFLGYDTPFYFQDVNLDGDLELVFNGYYQHDRENHALFVYSMSQNKFLTDPPFDRMSSQAKYDFKNNTITWFSSSAANYFAEYVYGFYRSMKDNTNYNFFLKELNVCSGNIYSKYQYTKQGEVISIIREKVSF